MNAKGVEMQVRKLSQVETALKSAKASLAVEGLTLSERQEQLVKDQLLGRISHDAFMKKALELTRNE
ncbi:hypothetical protein SAMN05518684_11764 [Salipaludibacillus aurantiacus]|uniref:Antitoxin VbhA domain-containing protein n=2 Tax=Bacillaceae TaxID=186817 RepID=A0A1H9WJA2_9BACI|nr:hypothetical protein SAMN05518684_11764 [Salipaludibacillus aurantiacus]